MGYSSGKNSSKLKVPPSNGDYIMKKNSIINIMDYIEEKCTFVKLRNDRYSDRHTSMNMHTRTYVYMDYQKFERW